MAVIHPGATLTPHFRDFLPGWLARQGWYQGDGRPGIFPVGFFRLEDPAGEVGIETHLVGVGPVVYQVPMSYRGAPLERLADGGPAAGLNALISTAEHSVLGKRWIYDAVHDPVWVAEMRRLAAAESTAAVSSKRGAGPVRAWGVRGPAWSAGTEPAVEVRRVLVPGPAPDGADVAGVVMGSWHANGADLPPVEGCLAALR